MRLASEAENHAMRTWAASNWWVWSLRIGQAIGVVGGLIVLLSAAVTHQVPFAIIGSLWLVGGSIGVGQLRGIMRRVSIEGDVVAFQSPRKELVVPATEIIDIRRRRGDFYHSMPIRVRTRSNGTLLLPPRVKGLMELLVELRRLNPNLTIGSSL
jgi:hypothetical protein